jgi:hypothetical protein
VRTGIVLALLCAGAAFPAAVAQACTCAESTPAQNLRTADVVFLGRVTDREPPAGSDAAASASEVTFTFAVSRVYKGHVTALQSVVSQGLAGFCGQTFELNDSVLLFADDQTERGAPQRYVTELCSGSEVVDAAPASFGEGTEPKGSLPVDTDARSGGGAPVVLLGGGAAVVLLAAAGGAFFVLRRQRARPDLPDQPNQQE